MLASDNGGYRSATSALPRRSGEAIHLRVIPRDGNLGKRADDVLAMCQSYEYLVPQCVPNDMMSERTGCRLRAESNELFALLQSTIHECGREKSRRP